MGHHSHNQKSAEQTMEEMEQAVEKRVPEKFKETNLKALKLGARAYGRSR